MAKWSDWLPDLAVHLPGCPSFTVEHEVRRAAIKFFESTRAWKAMLDPVNVRDDQAEIEVNDSVPADSRVVRVEVVWFNGRRLAVIGADELDAGFGDDWTAHTGAPGRYLQLLPDTMQLYPSPTSTGNLKVRASLCPTEKATTLPDSLMKYREAIGQGALGQLRLYADQPWTAPDLAAVNLAAFNTAIGSATAMAARSFGRARITSRKTWL